MSLRQGQIGLVTGASGAIGGAIAEALARSGVRVLLSGRKRERLEEAADRIRAGQGPEPGLLVADLADDGELERVAERIVDAHGGLDLLVHALGVYTAGPVIDTPLEELDRQLAVNLRAPWELTRRLLPGIVERRGQIVFVSSSAAVRPRGPVAAYAASKAALTAFATCLRDEVSPRGVRVLSVFPGRTASAMQAEVHRFEGRPYEPETLLQPAEVASTVVHALGLPRSAEVTDVHLRPAVSS